LDENTKGLFGLIDKWGTEHWSAATQKVNLDLLRDRLKIVDEEKKALLKRAEEAEKELTTAKSTMMQFHARSKQLESELERCSGPVPIELDQIDVSILSGFAQATEPVTYGQVIGAFPELAPQRVEYHLERLIAAGLMDRAIHFNGWTYRLMQAGREWLVKMIPAC
jgi:hypothetical protein